MTEVYRKSYRIGDLSDDARADLPFFTIMGEISNTVVTLRLQVLLCANGTQEPGPLGDVSWPAAILNVRLLAGFLWEAWQFICDKDNGAAFKAYEPFMGETSITAKHQISKYFSNKNNLIKLLRNKTAFHIDRETIDAAQAALSEEEVLVDYLGSVQGQVHYGGGRALTVSLVHKLVCASTVEESLLELRENVMGIATALQEFAEGVAESFLSRHVGLSEDDYVRNVVIVDGPDLEKTSMPFFGDIKPYRTRKAHAERKKRRMSELTTSVSHRTLRPGR